LYIDEIEHHGEFESYASPNATFDPIMGEYGAMPGAPDSMRFLIDDLRDEFKRQLVIQAHEREVAKRKRLVALTLVMAPVGLIAAAALIGRTSTHPRVEAKRIETRYGR
jgi:hypothetical protein